MNNKSYSILIDINNQILNFITAYVLISGFIIIANKNYSMALCAFFLFPVPFFSYYLCYHTSRKWLFVLSHALMSGIYFLIFRSSLLGWLSILYILAVAISNVTIQKEKKKNTSLVFAAVFFLSIIYCSYAIQDFQFTNFYLLLAVIYIVLFLSNMNLINYSKYFMIYENHHSIPAQIKKANNKVILILAILCLLMMCLFFFIPASEIVSYIGKIFKQLWNELKQFMPKLGNRFSNPNSLSDSPDTTNAHAQNSMPDAWYPFWQSLYVLLHPLVVIAIVTIAVLMFKKLLKHYRIKRHDVNKTIMLDEKREKLENPVKNLNIKKLTSILSPSNNTKIRKYFYKAIIQNHTVKKLSKDMTPTQLSAVAVKSDNTENKKLLTGYYEKARYSPWECSNDDVQAVKNLLR